MLVLNPFADDDLPIRYQWMEQPKQAA